MVAARLQGGSSRFMQRSGSSHQQQSIRRLTCSHNMSIRKLSEYPVCGCVCVPVWERAEHEVSTLTLNSEGVICTSFSFE